MFPKNSFPERHPIPRDRATAPSPTHTAAVTIPGKRTGAAAKLGERRFFNVADFSKLPFRRRQVLTTFPIGLEVKRSILDMQSVSSKPPVSAFLLIFSFFSAVREFKRPRPLFISIFFCCTAVRTSTAFVVCAESPVSYLNLGQGRIYFVQHQSKFIGTFEEVGPYRPRTSLTC